MKVYIHDIINKVKKFSKTLDNTALFIDKPWVLIDDDANFHKYIFKKGGELIMALNGEVIIGRWELVISAKSILIDRLKDKILFNQFFLDPAVMILKKDGPGNDFFILANENLISDGDVKHYLESLIARQSVMENNIVSYTTSLPIPTDDNNHDQNKKAFEITYPDELKCKDGTILTIEKHADNGAITLGDCAFISNKVAPSGKYKFGVFDFLIIKDGVIIEINML